MAQSTLRERNKIDKLNRIREAAQHLFGTKGFELTSTREIAAHADVGLATLFLYASDKRDLLFLACNDDLHALTDRAVEGVDRSKPIAEQLAMLFHEFFLFYNRNHLLSRDLLRELTFYTSGQQSARFQTNRQRTIERIANLVAAARQRGEIGCASSDHDIAQVVFYVFAAEVRRWLGGEDRSVDRGIEHLGQLLRVVLTGLDAPSAAR